MQLSFPVVSSLNTVHLFASNLKSSLLSCSTSGAQVVWKTFHNRSVDDHSVFMYTIKTQLGPFMIIYTAFHNTAYFDDI